MKIISEKIANNLAINKMLIETPKTDVLKVSSGKNVVFAIDVSGSMYYELPKIRQQLKNKIPNLITDKDTISIIWFSGKSQAGILKEGVQVTNLIDLQNLNEAIDRFLKPIGLTAFLPPINLTEQVINNLKENNKDFSFIFLSDGYNNDSVWSDVVSKLSSLESKISTATFIEYGYYADSNALTEMAELVGGEKIFAKDFDSYEQDFDKIINKRTESKIAIDVSHLKGKLRHNIFSFDQIEHSIQTYTITDDKILVQDSVKEVYFLSRYKVDSVESIVFNTPKLIASYLMADKLKYNIVEDLLVNIGDIALINQFGGAFGKEKLNDLKISLKKSAFDNSLLFKDGKQSGYRVDPKQFCVMDLIDLLQSSDENKFYPFHKSFNYNRIGAKSVTKVELTDEVKDKLSKAKSLKDVEKLTSGLEAPEFIYPDNASTIGFTFDDLVWNKSRANLSIQVRLNGKVKLPKNDFGLTEVDSYIYRNFTLIKDGILNITQLPVSLSDETFNILFDKGLLTKGNEVVFTNPPAINYVLMHLLDISSLPIINRSMTTNVSAKKLALHEFDLIQTQLLNKYLKDLKKEYDPKENIQSEALYSKEVADWLKEIGVTDFNGFSPKREIIESEDFYMAPTLVTKIEKTSTSPSVKSVFAKIDDLIKAETDTKVKAKPLNLMEGFMKSHIDNINPQIYEGGEFDYTVRESQKIDLDALNSKLNETNQKRKKHLLDIARIKFGLILSRSWFTEFENMDQNELEGVKFKGVLNPLKVKFEFKDEKVNL